MEQLSLILIVASLVLSVFNTIIVIFCSFYFYKKTQKNLAEIPEDLSEALTKLVEMLQKEFKANYETHQQMTDWEHDALQKVMQGFSENFSFIARQQFLNENLLNNILSSLGFRSRFDEGEIEKPKRTYADPPSPVEIESLKIINDKSESK